LKSEDWHKIIQGGAAFNGLDLDPTHVHCFYRHMREMLQWNRKFNLTAITDPEDIAIKHFLDAVAPADKIPARARILDVGTGAGFPGLPLKVMRPASFLTLIDSSRKKVNFLRHVIRKLELDQVEAVQVRIEELVKDPPADSPFDVIVSRAFTSASALTGLLGPLLADGAVLMLWKGPEIEQEIRDLQKLSSRTGADLVVEVHPYRLGPAAISRNLICVKSNAAN
jgi:16S rRNA (guanine527-N7)-methyltransferase